MKKKILSLALALIICLVIIPTTALAAASLNIDKVSYQEGESITATVSGITNEADPYIAIYKKGTAANEYSREWFRVQKGTSTKTFSNFYESGDYEMRLYSKTYATDADFIDSVSFTVSKTQVSGNISIDKTNYEDEEIITIEVSGITAEMVKLRPYAGIYKKGTEANKYGEWKEVSEGESTITLTAPNESGEYEVRLYKKVYATDSDFIASAPFTVNGTGIIDEPIIEDKDDENNTASSKFVAEPIPTNSLPGADLNAEIDFSWTGKWEDSNYGEINITQQGNAITGNYPWDSGKITATAQGNMIYGAWAESPTYTPPNDGGDFEFVMSEDGMSFVGHSRYGSDDEWRPWNGKRIKEEVSWENASSWATENLIQAEELGLIPECLVGADMTKDITRAEFAAVSVKVYEELADSKALPSVVNPFKDTNDVEVLKAYNVGITSGTAVDAFSPETLLNREQAAAMLTRVFKKVTMPGWTLNTNTNPEFALDYSGVKTFSDDASISDWAKESVYFMVKNSIISGMGNGIFAPKNVTTEEQANGYANATREQALTIAVKMVQNLR